MLDESKKICGKNNTMLHEYTNILVKTTRFWVKTSHHTVLNEAACIQSNHDPVLLNCDPVKNIFSVKCLFV